VTGRHTERYRQADRGRDIQTDSDRQTAKERTERESVCRQTDRERTRQGRKKKRKNVICVRLLSTEMIDQLSFN